ncbi:MAG TPA: hypothetical protein VJU16_08610, partial [Planctomycetota bacterium]|nr:hypothetical protein [Planctomycetota bacterium]
RSTWLGQQIERDSSILGAKRSARAQTAEMFGMAGRVATPEQILAVYNQILGMEMRDATGKQRVEGVIDMKNAEETLAALKYFFTNFGDVMKQFMAGIGNNGPGIR